MDQTADPVQLIAGLGFSAVTVMVLALLAVLLSSYVRIVTVLSIVRAGLGANTLPSAFVTGGLALCLTLFVMYPTAGASLKEMDRIAQAKSGRVTDMDRAQAVNAGLERWKEFLIKNSEPGELQKFSQLAVRLNAGATPEATSTQGAKTIDAQPAAPQTTWQVAAPAFFVSELKHGFRIGLSLLLPFLLIELLTANVLAAVGLDQLSPTFVSLPFKLFVLVAVDGWGLITSNLVSSYIS